MDRDTWSDPAVAKEIAAHFISLKLADEEHAALIQALGVQGYPATLFFTSDRRLIGRIDGHVGADELLHAVQQSKLHVR